MPNPYHDETGRFCSPGEMLAAAKHLMAEGSFTSYEMGKKLHEEFTTIQKAKAGENFSPLTMKKIKVLETTLYLPNTEETSVQQIKLTQDWSDDELDDVEETVMLARNQQLEAINEAQGKLKVVENRIAEDTGYSPIEYSNLLKEHKTIGKNFLFDLYDEAVKKGVSRKYAHNYVFNRLAPKMGIAGGYNDYNGRMIAAEDDLTPITPNTMPLVKNVDDREKMKQAVQKVYGSGEPAEWNKSTREVFNLPSEELTAWRSLTHEIAVKQKTAKDYDSTLKTIAHVRSWRRDLQNIGVSKKARLIDLNRVNPTYIQMNRDNEIVNVWAYKDGVPDRIIKTVPAEIPVKYANATVHKMVGESGATYLNSTHYYNYTSSATKKYVVIDPLIKGTKPFITGAGNSIVFDYSIDSGD